MYRAPIVRGVNTRHLNIISLSDELLPFVETEQQQNHNPFT